MDDEASYTSAQIDPTYGQRSALPDFYEEDDESVIEALTYLRSVRSEASTIPHLLVAEGKGQVDDKEWSHLGRYEDGAYTGTAAYQESESGMSTNQQAYYDALRSDFVATRYKLSQSLPPAATTLAKPSTVLNPSSSHAQFLHGFLYTSPIPRDLAKASQEVIMIGLKRYASVLNKRNFQQGDEESSHLGAWGWALLAKCREIGQLDSEDVSVVREVGKIASKLIKKIRASMIPSLESVEDGEVQDDIEVDGSSISQNGKTGVCDSSAVTTLDILITIIGEEFGQRDLLEAREIW